MAAKKATLTENEKINAMQATASQSGAKSYKVGIPFDADTTHPAKMLGYSMIKTRLPIEGKRADYREFLASDMDEFTAYVEEHGANLSYETVVPCMIGLVKVDFKRPDNLTPVKDAECIVKVIGVPYVDRDTKEQKVFKKVEILELAKS